MSQHLINDFIHRTTIFKPLTGEKIINKKLVKYQASNRKNNTSPQDIEESVYDVKTDKLHSAVKVEALSEVESEMKHEVEDKEEKRHKENGAGNDGSDSDEPIEHIDIIV